MSTLVLLAPIVTLVMLYIRGDLVLSLGLIGSLSIIRFRTPIKERGSRKTEPIREV